MSTWACVVPGANVIVSVPSLSDTVPIGVPESEATPAENARAPTAENASSAFAPPERASVSEAPP